MMEVILLERIEKLGQMGDVVKVKPGFARNYLLPRKKALRATSNNKAAFESQRVHLEAENIEQRSEAERVGKDLDGVSVVIVRAASDSDQLYGSVTTRDIANAVIKAGFTIDRRQVQLDSPIKTVGLHPVRVVLHPEVAVQVVVNVARSEEEAETQARGGRVNRQGDEDEEDKAIAAAAAFEAIPEDEQEDPGAGA